MGNFKGTSQGMAGLEPRVLFSIISDSPAALKHAAFERHAELTYYRPRSLSEYFAWPRPRQISPSGKAEPARRFG